MTSKRIRARAKVRRDVALDEHSSPLQPGSNSCIQQQSLQCHELSLSLVELMCQIPAIAIQRRRQCTFAYGRILRATHGWHFVKIEFVRVKLASLRQTIAQRVQPG